MNYISFNIYTLNVIFVNYELRYKFIDKKIDITILSYYS